MVQQLQVREPQDQLVQQDILLVVAAEEKKLQVVRQEAMVEELVVVVEVQVQFLVGAQLILVAVAVELVKAAVEALLADQVL